MKLKWLVAGSIILLGGVLVVGGLHEGRIGENIKNSKIGGAGGSTLDGVKVVLAYGEPFLPVRDFCEAIGATVSWDKETYEIGIERNDLAIQLKISSHQARVNQQVYTLDSAPTLKDDITLLPVEILTDLLGVSVVYDETTGEIRINENQIDVSQSYALNLMLDTGRISSTDQIEFKEVFIADKTYKDSNDNSLEGITFYSFHKNNDASVLYLVNLDTGEVYAKTGHYIFKQDVIETNMEDLDEIAKQYYITDFQLVANKEDYLIGNWRGTSHAPDKEEGKQHWVDMVFIDKNKDGSYEVIRRMMLENGTERMTEFKGVYDKITETLRCEFVDVIHDTTKDRWTSPDITFSLQNNILKREYDSLGTTLESVWERF